MTPSEERIILDVRHCYVAGIARQQREFVMKSFRRLLQLALIPVCVELLGSSPARNETFPTGPVKFITPIGAGSGTDAAMRIIVEQLGQVWGQHAVLVNQPGANGALAARAALSAAPDGQTLHMAIASIFTLLPYVQPANAVDVDAFVPIAFVGEVPMAIAVGKSQPIASLSDLVAQSKRRPDGMSIALTRGGIPHVTAELFQARSGANLTQVFYTGSALAMSDVLSGRVPAIVDGLGGPVAQGQLKLLAIAAAQRVKTHPDVPTVAETYPGVVGTGWFALVAPPGTPGEIVKKVNSDLAHVLSKPEVRQKLDAMTITTRTMSPAELSAFIRSERELWRPIAQRIGGVVAR
jgi:tripartite-type tricarboxylate transporter receptor subunit TctC